MTGPPLPRYTGVDTQLDPDDLTGSRATASVIAMVLGVAVWGAGWGWDAPFTPDTGAGMFTGPSGGVRLAGCAVGTAAIAAVLGYRGWPWAGAFGVTVGFGLFWSADAFVTYSNPFWTLGVVPMWVALGAGGAAAAWIGWTAKARAHRTQTRAR